MGLYNHRSRQGKTNQNFIILLYYRHLERTAVIFFISGLFVCAFALSFYGSISQNMFIADSTMDKYERAPETRSVKEGTISSIKTEATVMWDVLQHGNVEDPVFEGIVREFMRFDATLIAIFNGVDKFMLGVEHLCAGLVLLSEAMVNGFTKHTDNTIASDICRFREAIHKITRLDAPHACIAKLRRDLEYNIVIPLQNHLGNNKVIKSSISLRRRRLNEVQMCQRKINQILGVTPKLNSRKIDSGGNQSDIQGGNTTPNGGSPAARLPPRLTRDLKNAEASLEYAKTNFKAVDRPVFEWLMMLDAYKCDLYDSILQTLKYLQYEFLAESSHSLSHTMPSRMQFRPMVEMTPEQLKPQVDMELEAYEDDEASLDSTATLLKKWERDGGSFQGVETTVSSTVDPLSLASLVSQGFEENLARKALLMHGNDTQAALDTLLNSIDILENVSSNDAFVRAPTSLKWTNKYKGVRSKDRETRETEFKETQQNQESKQAEKARDTNGAPISSNLMGDDGDDGPSTHQSKGTTEQSSTSVMDDLDLFSWGDTPVAPKNTTAVMNESTSGDLSLMDMDSVPTDLSKGVQLHPLPDLFGTFKPANCEWSKQYDPSNPTVINDPTLMEALQPSLDIPFRSSLDPPQTNTSLADANPFDALNPSLIVQSPSPIVPQKEGLGGNISPIPSGFSGSGTMGNSIDNLGTFNLDLKGNAGGFGAMDLNVEKNKNEEFEHLFGDVLKDF
ncbi:UBA/TS-N domain-containing protein [Cardiosporidium cionae]|uniref:UBA/TS-N domain-containing protein n=1 Tax=Cardiosporidium cionae TaxID=476202 RepID=A0ABQ7J5Y9_9APIC|nr:UBA/TS-N domain-containing protein [Cardiosporidium cionae]|eukprot:KAF8819100.1 UBA/TS-N domain-containing protein [Cardiosporidium cionae]